MPAGLLLSPTDRAERPGDGALAASLPPAAGPLASPVGTTSGPFGESPVGAVPFSVMRRPSSGLRLRRFPLIPAPEPPSSRAIPARWLGQRHGHRTPHPLQGPAMASLPCPGRHASFLPCPSHGSIAPGVFLRPLSQAILPLFSPAGPPSQRCVRPAPSRPEDCALNQHFSSHPGTFVQRKMIL